MKMPVLMTCPECQTKMKVSDELMGKKIRCRSCKEVIVIQEDEEGDRPTRTKPRQNDEEEPRRPGKNRSRSRDDDEDDSPARSRKSRPRRSQKKSSPVLLYSLLGVGLLVLIGGGLFLLTRSEKNKEGQGNTSTATNSKEGWKEIKESEAKFSVQMPITNFQGVAMPKHNPKNHRSPLVKQITEWLTFDPKTSQEFTVTYADFGDRSLTNDSQSLRQTMSYAGSMVFMKGNVVSETPIQVGSYPAIDYVFRTSSPLDIAELTHHIYLRVVIVGSRLYALTLETPDNAKSSPAVKTFFDSLQIHD